MKRIAILGSTGSVGISALKIIAAFKDRFRVAALSANTNHRLLAEQAGIFKPRYVGIRDEAKAKDLRGFLSHRARIFKGIEGLCGMAAAGEVDTVLVAMSGTEALLPLMSAIKAGKSIALANKECIVSAGGIITALAKKKGVRILPVDSEHSAIFQCLEGKRIGDVRKLILTGTGGPLRDVSKNIFGRLSLKRILDHPTWKMGRKITVDSATLMNKGLEVIEAMHLFGVGLSKIDVLLHPEAIIHSMVEFRDGMIMANLFYPDMRLPILYALSYPERLDSGLPRVDFLKAKKFTFHKPDTKKFPALSLAYRAARLGGTMPACLNSANEEAVRLYLDGRAGFTDIIRLIEKAMDRHKNVKDPTLDEISKAEKWAREKVRSLC